MGQTARLLLNAHMLARARAGEHNLSNRLKAALEQAGWRLEFGLLGEPHGDWDITWMEPPGGRHGLCLRPTYVLPFFRIDRTSERWNFAIARQSFVAEDVDPAISATFAGYWRRRLHGDGAAGRGGGIYVPLQGRLLQRRSFQSASPVDMVRAVLRRFHDREVCATFHPNETYEDHERRALSDLAQAHPRLQLSTGDMVQHLRRCDLVVTENSSAAFHALFYDKPSVLFAGADFRHVTLNVPEIGAEAAFERAIGHRPPGERYLWWFLKGTAINAGAPEAEAQILAALRVNGWPI
jgi:hypothetical protein